MTAGASHSPAVEGVATPALGVELRVVTGFGARLRGLIGRPPPAPGSGWLFPRCAAVHTWAMGYAIDVVFLAQDGRILRVVAGLAPWRLCACRRAALVLELAAGEAGRLEMQPGRRVVLPAGLQRQG